MVIVFKVNGRTTSFGIFGKVVLRYAFFLPLLKVNRTIPLLTENGNSIHNYALATTNFGKISFNTISYLEISAYVELN